MNELIRVPESVGVAEEGITACHLKQRFIPVKLYIILSLDL